MLLLLPLKIHPALPRTYALAPGGLSHTIPQPVMAPYAVTSA